jgi:hypothetical protein
MKALTKNNKKNYLKSFEELYNRNPSKEELKAFIECMRAKKKEKNNEKQSVFPKKGS